MSTKQTHLNTNRSSIRLGLIAAALVSLTFAATAARDAAAASINYGDFSGTTVMYLDVTESSITDPVPLYGDPQLVGNSLIFRPTDFGSTSTGASSDMTDGQLSTTIMSTPNDVIHTIHIEESGDFLLAGSSNAFAMAMIMAPVNVRVTHIDGQEIMGPMPQAQIPLTLLHNGSPTDGIFTLDDEGAGPGLWSGSLTIDIDALIQQAGLSGHATKVLFSMDNKLATASEAGTVADIHKKDLALMLTTNPIPEPSTLVLCGIGAVVLGGAGWRRRRSQILA